MRPRLVLLLLPFVLVACGAPVVEQDPAVDEHPGVPETPASSEDLRTGAPDELALGLSSSSAWPSERYPGVPAQPAVRIAGDGSFRAVLGGGADPYRYLQGRLDALVLDELLTSAVALPTDGYGEPGLDGGFTTVHLGPAAGERRDVAVWSPTTHGFSAEVEEHRARLVALVDEVETAVREVGRPWTPTRWAMVTRDVTRTILDRHVSRWPLALDPRARTTDGLWCSLVRGRAARRALELAGGPGSSRTWLLRGRAHRVQVLPVLAQETCAGLTPYVVLS